MAVCFSNSTLAGTATHFLQTNCVPVSCPKVRASFVRKLYSRRIRLNAHDSNKPESRDAHYYQTSGDLCPMLRWQACRPADHNFAQPGTAASTGLSYHRCRSDRSGSPEPSRRLRSIALPRIIDDHLWRRLAHFQLRADFLKNRSKSFDLLLLFHDRRFQFLHFAALFEELVEQHRVHLVIAHAVGFSFLVPHHKVRIHLLHILGYESELRCASCINFLLVTESDWF